MNPKEIRELIEFLVEKDIAEFELERGDVKIRIKRGAESIASPPPIVMPAPVAHVGHSTAAPLPAAAPAESAKPQEDGLHQVKSPIVGTFYESPSPGSPPFVKIGDTVEAGQILCIVEAMKLMNEIESDVSGEIVKKLVENGQPVEYGQPLFAVRSK
jgi:acetyl-CoA carboxylase biotin carboxyl carrier protein